MSDLLAPEIVTELLEATGALTTGTSTRLIKTGAFKSFAFEEREKDELDLAPIERLFETTKIELENEWREIVAPDFSFSDFKVEVTDFKKLSQRQSSWCFGFRRGENKGFLFYWQPDGFYSLLDKFLGGGAKSAGKKNAELTDVEKSFLSELTSAAREAWSKSFVNLFNKNLDPDGDLIDLNEQNDKLSGEIILASLSWLVGEQNVSAYFVLPTAFVKDSLRPESHETSSSEKSLDPLWQAVVTEAIQDAEVDLVVSVGSFDIPFEASAAIKVGDVFPWPNAGNDVVVLQDNAPRFLATLGSQDGFYAIRVKTVFSA